jgi:Cu/Ag efflux pump CusA
VDRGQEYLVRGLGRERTVEDQRAAMVQVTDGVPLMVGDVSTVREGTEPQRGTASHDTRPAVIVCVQKQPGANTLEPMTAVEGVLAEIEGTLPRGVVIEKENFRHSDLIRAAIHNISVAMRDDAHLVDRAAALARRRRPGGDRLRRDDPHDGAGRADDRHRGAGGRRHHRGRERVPDAAGGTAEAG